MSAINNKEKDYSLRGRETFKKGERINRLKEFKKIFGSSNRLYTNSFTIYWSGNDKGYTRVAVITKKRIGNSVKRHRIKRILIEIFRRNKGYFIKNVDLIIIPNFSTKKIKYCKIEKDLFFLLNKWKRRIEIMKIK